MYDRVGQQSTRGPPAPPVVFTSRTPGHVVVPRGLCSHHRRAAIVVAFGVQALHDGAGVRRRRRLHPRLPLQGGENGGHVRARERVLRVPPVESVHAPFHVVHAL